MDSAHESPRKKKKGQTKRPAAKSGGKKAARSSGSKSPYFLTPGPQGSVVVWRRPSGNRIQPKECGTMPSRAVAMKLVQQLQKAESVVHDLFLEATDDGMEALEAVLEACRTAVLDRAQAGAAGATGAPGSSGGAARRRRGRRGGRPGPAGGASDAGAPAPPDVADTA